LNYIEDKDAEVDMNLVMTEDGRFVEVQGSGEEATFAQEQLDAMLAIGKTGLAQLFIAQRNAIAQGIASAPERPQPPQKQKAPPPALTNPVLRT
jgi:ribonuclease PH